jgi:hypothetical protein
MYLYPQPLNRASNKWWIGVRGFSSRCAFCVAFQLGHCRFSIQRTILYPLPTARVVPLSNHGLKSFLHRLSRFCIDVETREVRKTKKTIVVFGLFFLPWARLALALPSTPWLSSRSVFSISAHGATVSYGPCRTKICHWQNSPP